jgi:hypothetical protein
LNATHETTDRNVGRLIRTLVANCAQYWPSGILIGLGLLLEMSFNSLVPFSFKYIVDDGLVGGNHELLIRIVTGLGIGAILVSVAGLGRDYGTAHSRSPFWRAKATGLPQNPRMITKNIGMLLLAIYLILVGITTLFHIGIGAIVIGIVALIAGILILIGK